MAVLDLNTVLRGNGGWNFLQGHARYEGVTDGTDCVHYSRKRSTGTALDTSISTDHYVAIITSIWWQCFKA